MLQVASYTTSLSFIYLLYFTSNNNIIFFVLEESDGRKTYYIHMERQLVEPDHLNFKTYQDAFVVWFAFYFNFKIQYPKEVRTTMDMVQRYYFKIHPDSGGRMKKG